MSNPIVDNLAQELIVRIATMPITPTTFGPEGGIDGAVKTVLGKAFEAGAVERVANEARAKFPRALQLPSRAPVGWTPFAYSASTGKRGRVGTFGNLADANREIGYLREFIVDLRDGSWTVPSAPRGAAFAWTPFPFPWVRSYAKGDSGAFNDLGKANIEVGHLRDHVMDLQDASSAPAISLQVAAEKAASFANGKREGRAELARELVVLRDRRNELEDAMEDTKDEIDVLIDMPNADPESESVSSELHSIIT